MSEQHNGAARQGERRGRPRKNAGEALDAARGHLGHNAPDEDDDVLLSYAKRILDLREQRKSLNEEIGEVKAEAKDAGFENKILMKCISLMEMTAEARSEQDATIQEYRRRCGIALGDYADTPLGEATMMREAAEQY